MERVVNREKTKNKKYIKEIKVSSMTIKFGGSLLDLKNENSRMCCCVDVFYRKERNNKTKE